MTDGTKTHWDKAYGARPDVQLSWHEEEPEISLELAMVAGITGASSVIDIGGGTSPFAGALLDRGIRDVTVLDVSSVALDRARTRLGATASTVNWIAADVTRWVPERTYDLWHDRAVFHFMVTPEDRAAYLDRLSLGIAVGRHALIATFAPDGPEMCSGLPTMRYSPVQLAAVLGGDFSLIAYRRHMHITPHGKPQSFQFSLFRRNA